MSEVTYTPDNAPSITPRTHPDFSRHEDTVLQSADNVRFYVARRDLERTSRWFRAKFESAPQISSGGEEVSIPVLEDSLTMEALLKMAL